MGEQRRRFDPEFRAGAVRIVEETGKPVAQVARDLGVSPYTLHNWVRADRAAAGGGGGLSESEREERISTNTVAARMAELCLAGRPPRRRRSLTRQGRRPAAPDLVRRNFTAVAPDVLWCGDVTQIDTDEGPLYLATTEDLFSRRMLGHAMSAHHDAALVVASLQMAVTTAAVTSAESSSIPTADRSTPGPRPRPPAAGTASPSRWAGSAARSTTPPPRRSTAR